MQTRTYKLRTHFNRIFNIVNHEFRRLCQTRGITYNTSFKFHQQDNGQIEASVKTVKPILLTKLFNDKRAWSKAFKTIKAAYNKHLILSITGLSSHQIIYDDPYNANK
eukprot:TRINITY_DN3622_c0_g1_i9.p2 TRINITY_DN3622_c0_g1~~TRINITY_DN3622_c0_g1_i9.p2  ORF type:complete len:108 (-),score=5.41 TRINITY_DN3622_c0_g1_i9:482-805(-)